MWLIDYWVWIMLDLQFNAPARMIARNDAMEQWLKHAGLDGFKVGNLCKPY